jgi:hypothetical protein
MASGWHKQDIWLIKFLHKYILFSIDFAEWFNITVSFKYLQPNAYFYVYHILGINLKMILMIGYEVCYRYSCGDNKIFNYLKIQSHSYFTTGGLPPISLSWRENSLRLTARIIIFLIKHLWS